MANWTPEQWGTFMTQFGVLMTVVLGALGATGKVYIDYMSKANTTKIKLLIADVAKLKRDRIRDRRRISQLVAVLEAHDIPVPPPLELPDEELEE